VLGTPFYMVHATYVCVYSNIDIQASERQSAGGHSLKEMEIKKLIYPAQCSLYQGRREVILLLWQTKWCKSTYVTLLANEAFGIWRLCAVWCYSAVRDVMKCFVLLF